MVRARLKDGDDVFTSQGVLVALIHVDGQGGNDRVDIGLGGDANHLAADRMSVIEIRGGEGDDELGLNYEDAVVDGQLRLEASGGAGRDAVLVAVTNVTGHGLLDLHSGLGDGGERRSPPI